MGNGLVLVGQELQLVAVRKVGESTSARYTTLIFLTMGIMMPLGGWLSDRWHPGRVLVVAFAVVLVGAYMFYVVVPFSFVALLAVGVENSVHTPAVVM